jgi:hypothetical protein
MMASKKMCFGMIHRAILYILTNVSEVLTAYTITAITHHPEDGSSKHLWNADQYLRDYTAQQTRRQSSSSKNFFAQPS